MNKVPVTVRGHGLLEEELKRLKSVDRPQVIRAIAEAREHWRKTHGGTPLGEETMARLDLIEAVAKARGLLADKEEAS